MLSLKLLVLAAISVRLQKEPGVYRQNGNLRDLKEITYIVLVQSDAVRILVAVHAPLRHAVLQFDGTFDILFLEDSLVLASEG